MATYVINPDGSVTEKKKKKTTYVIGSDGSVTIKGVTPQQVLKEQVPQAQVSPKEKRTWFKAGDLWDDGYQFGDVTKTILATGQDLAEDVGAGLVGIGEKAVDLLVAAVPYIAQGQYYANGGGYNLQADAAFKQMNESAKGLASDFVAKDLYDEEEVAKTLLSASATQQALNALGVDTEGASVSGQKTDALAQSGGQLLAQLGANAIAPGAGMALMATTAFGSEAESALRDGATLDEAAFSGVISAGAEMLTEKIGGISFGGKTLTDAAFSNLSRHMTGKLAKVLITSGKITADALAEGGEEIMSGYMSAIGQKLSYMSEKEITELFSSEDALESFIGGAVLGGLGGGGDAIKSAIKGVDPVSGLTKNEQAVVDQVYKDRVAEEQKSGKLTRLQKNEIYEQVVKDMDDGRITTDEIEKVLSKEELSKYKALSEEAAEYAKLYDTESGKMSQKQTDRLKELTAKNSELSYEKRLEQARQKITKDTAQKVSGDRLNESYLERDRKNVAYTNDAAKYKGEFARKTVQSAIDSKVLNNTRYSHRFVDLLAKIAEDRGVAFDFTNNKKLKETGMALEGVTVNGFLGENGITINANSSKALNSVVGHEVTHVLEGTDMYQPLEDIVFEYAKATNQYDKRMQELRSLYEGKKGYETDFEAKLKKELVADLVGDYIFTDEKFVESLYTKNRSLWDKVKHEIDYLLRVATAGSEEARKIEKAKKVFEKVYESKTKKPTGDGGVRYSLSDAKVPTREELERKSPIKVVDISTPQTQGSFAERRKQILSNLDEVISKPYRNIDTGAMIFLTKQSYTHAFSNSGEVQLNAAEHLPELIENAVLTHVEPKTHGSDYANGVYTFFGAAKAGRIHPVKLKVKEYTYSRQDLPRNIKEYFDSNPQDYAASYDTVVLEVQEIEESPTGSVKDMNHNDSFLDPDGLLTIKVADLLGLVKGEYEKYLPKAGPADVRYSLSPEADKKYLDAVSHRDMETAQKMVDQAAQDAGYTVKAYHGTDAETFNEFDKGRIGESTGVSILGDGFYFADNKKTAKQYGKNVYTVYLKQENPYSATTDDAYRLKAIDLESQGHDSVVLPTGKGNIYMVLDPNQIKSAETVTYDDNGDVIPLTRRFNTDSNDIRYSISNQEDTTPTKGWNIRGEDVAFVNSTEDLAPIGPNAKRVYTPDPNDLAPLPEKKLPADNRPITTANEIPSAKLSNSEKEIANNQRLREELQEDHTKRDELERTINRINRMLEYDKGVLDEEFNQKRELLKDKNAYISHRASELHNEIRNLKKGVKASELLGELLDTGYEWSSIRAALVNIKHTPGERVNVNSAIESIAREMLNDDYEDSLYNLDDEYHSRVKQLEENAKKQRSAARKAAQPTRKDLHQGIVDDIKHIFTESGYDFDEVLKKAKNLSTFATVDNTPQRVMEKALGYKEGNILSDLTVNKVAQNETEGIKWLNSFTDRKNGLLAQISKQYNIKPGSKESAAAQMYAEGFYVGENNDIIAYGDAELAMDFPDAQVQRNIKGLANDSRIRQIYDETLAMINESRTRNAYPEIPRLDNYFLHFRAMDDTFSRLGLPFNPNDIRAKDLPADLNGVTADLKPGQPYFASAMHRTGKRTSFDLLGGLERYLSSAKNQIYHIDDIQTLRALRNYIADTYGQANGLEGLDALSEEEAQDRIEKVYNSHLSTFAKFLNEEANILAGKTALIDRGLEGVIGRRGITFLDTVNKQVGSNMVGFNLSSSLTNFLPVAQTFAKSNKADFVKAFTQTVANKVGSVFGRGDDFAENSPVIIRRKGADRFYRTPFQKVGDAGYVFMSAVDDISTELIARTKYNELTRKGMDSQQAHYETDKWVSKLMGDRSLGQMPQLYNSKMLGLVTKFQLEVRNQLDSQFYDTIQEAKVSNEDIQDGLERNAKTAAKVASTFVQLAVAQHLFGKAFESVAGYNPAFDIISVLIKAFGWDDDEESEDTALDNIEQGFFELLEDLPYTSTFTGGRIPIESALPIREFLMGEDQYGNEKSRWETLGDVAPYYILPGGYGQLKKTAQGLNMFSDDHPIAGSYTDSGNLRFPVEENIGNMLQAGIFGQYASQNARDYFDNERSPLNEKQIQEFMDVGLSVQDYWRYRDGLKGLSSLAEKADYIDSLDLTDEQKNVLINNLADRKEDIDMSDYGEYGSFEEFDYASKNPEKYAFLQENNVSYNEYMNFDDDTKDAYDWAYKNPAKHTLSKAITGDVAKYRKYTSDLYDIKADKDSSGKSISNSRKKKVVAYINGLDMDYGQKILLYRSEYTTDDRYNRDIVEYLNSRDDISAAEMRTILEALNFKVSEDGKISW